VLLPNFLGAFFRDNLHFVQQGESALAERELLQRYTGRAMQVAECNAPAHVSEPDKYLMLMLLGSTATRQLFQDQLIIADRAKELLLAQQNSVKTKEKTVGGSGGKCSDAPKQMKNKKKKNNDFVVYTNTGACPYSIEALYFTRHAFLKTLYDICHALVFKTMQVAAGMSGWENENIQELVHKVLTIDSLLNSEAEISDEKQHRLSLGCGVTHAVVRLREMHADARQILISEILGDIVYMIFFGGSHLTYDRDKIMHKIDVENTPLDDIQKEIQFRLGWVPGKEDEQMQKTLMNRLMHNNLIFLGNTYDKEIYEYRHKISYTPIANETKLIKLIRVFKNETKRHHSSALRLVGRQHHKFKKTVFEFCHDLKDLAAQHSLMWLQHETQQQHLKRRKLMTTLDEKIVALDMMHGALVLKGSVDP